MKIVNICIGAPFTEGYSYQDNLLSKYQSKLGHDVTVITTTRCRGEDGKEIRTEAGTKMLENGVRLIRLKCKGKLLSFIGYYPEIYKKLCEVQPDFIFIHGLASMVPHQVIRYKRKCKNKEVRVVADNHQDSFNTITNRFPFKQQLLLFLLLWKSWITYVKKVYGTTSWRKSFAREIYEIPEDKLDTLIMGIDSELLPEHPQEVRKIIRDQLQIPQDTFVFVTGGKLNSRKKILEMMEAFKQVTNPKTVFLIFGSVADEVKERFQEYIEKDARFKYVNYIPSECVKEYFIASDFGVFAGRHSVLWEEAIGCGLPCLFRKYEDVDHTEVCGNCIGMKELSVEQIREIMEKVVCDSGYYDELKQASLRAAERFSYWKIAEKSLECVK